MRCRTPWRCASTRRSAVSPTTREPPADHRDRSPADLFADFLRRQRASPTTAVQALFQRLHDEVPAPDGSERCDRSGWTMHGFAVFRDEAVVDFTDADFFVLVGATGSGKSTVIDAITFALYGTVPRWNHRSMVMYGLAPTAIRGTVRLVFDVADARYVVARELRRTKAGVHVRNARLERLIDPTGLGGIDDATEVVDADGGVTPAVEKLLGLPYEHFCQCVVLPQGEFADLACPVCTTKLKEACRRCKQPLEPLWQVCPYCETPVESPRAVENL